MTLKVYSSFVCLVFLLGVIGCGEGEDVSATLLPTEKGSALLFRGYVTDAEQELVGEIYNFARRFSHVDTVDGIRVFAFYNDDKKEYFYVDEAG
ncbi:hypothetical protein GWN42_22605, partial [candidate division KSB1 bacterium]|nr:hypothetical protein [candidate division KSB1 bacterium]